MAFLFFCSTKTYAESKAIAENEINKLYEQGVNSGAFTSGISDRNDFSTQVKNIYFPQYQELIDSEQLSTSDKFDSWIAENNYGQPTNTQSMGTRIKSAQLRSGFTPQAGDIILTNSTSNAGLIGHVAICNGSGYVLDMPGGKVNNLSDNNLQRTWAAWKSYYKSKSGSYIIVYRMTGHTSLAHSIGSYADTHFWSTTHAAWKNIHIPYKITTALHSFSPSYCSKLVYQAYYNGSGSLPVMVPKPSIWTIAPLTIAGCFQNNYSIVPVARF